MPPTTKNNILVLTYWSYNDALIQTYTLPYLLQIRDYINVGSKLFLVTLEKEELSSEEKLKIKQELAKYRIEWIELRYHKSKLKAFLYWIIYLFRLLKIIKVEKIKTLHAWCTPAGSIAVILSILTGKRLIIDSFEPHAEAMVENGSWSSKGLLFKFLFYFEKLQAKKADSLIIIANGMQDYIKEKYHTSPISLYYKPACVDLTKFNFNQERDNNLMQELGLESKIICLYAGKLGGIYLEKEVFDLFRVFNQYFNDNIRFLLLTNNSREEIEVLCSKSNVSPDIIISKFVPHSEIEKYFRLADFALTPVKPVPTKRYCSPIKDGEYWAMGLPVIISKNISDDSDIIEENNIGYVLQSYEENELVNAAKAVEKLLKQDKENLQLKIRKIAEEKRSFAIAEKVYSDLFLVKITS